MASVRLFLVNVFCFWHHELNFVIPAELGCVRTSWVCVWFLHEVNYPCGCSLVDLIDPEWCNCSGGCGFSIERSYGPRVRLHTQICKQLLLRPAHQVTLHIIWTLYLRNTYSSNPSNSVKSSNNSKGDTRSFKRFTSSHPELILFTKFLISIEGKNKSEEAAESVVRDCAKFMHYCNSTELEWKNFECRSSLRE